MYDSLFSSRASAQYTIHIRCYLENPSRIWTNVAYRFLDHLRVRLPNTAMGRLSPIISKPSTPSTMKQFSRPESIQKLATKVNTIASVLLMTATPTMPSRTISLGVLAATSIS